MTSPNALHTARYGNLLARTLGIEDKNPAGEVATEIFPTLVLGEDRFEWRALAGEYSFCASGSHLNAAGSASIVLFNPANSSTLVVVRQAAYVDGAGVPASNLGAFRGGTGTPNNAQVNTERPTDQRIGTGFIQSNAQIWSHNGSYGTYNVFQVGLNAGVRNTHLFPSNFVIRPGFGFAITSFVTNHVVVGSFLYTERPLLERERSPL